MIAIACQCSSSTTYGSYCHGRGGAAAAQGPVVTRRSARRALRGRGRRPPRPGAPPQPPRLPRQVDPVTGSAGGCRCAGARESITGERARTPKSRVKNECSVESIGGGDLGRKRDEGTRLRPAVIRERITQRGQNKPRRGLGSGRDSAAARRACAGHPSPPRDSPAGPAAVRRAWRSHGRCAAWVAAAHLAGSWARACRPSLAQWATLPAAQRA